MTEEPMCYGGRCPECGNLCAATVDNPEHKKDVIKDVQMFMKEGLTIERITCDEVRSSLKSCNCHEKKSDDRQGNLFDLKEGASP